MNGEKNKEKIKKKETLINDRYGKEKPERTKS